MKTTKRDWLNFTAGFVTATIMALAVSDATGATKNTIHMKPLVITGTSKL